MRRRLTYLTTAGLAALPFSLAAAAECACPEGSLEKALRDADRVFRAEIVSATLDSESGDIALDVEVGEVVRGLPEARYRLTTPLPEACGIPVYVGYSDIFVLAPGEARVSSCTGSGRDVERSNYLMVTAVELVDLPVADVSGALRIIGDKFNHRHAHAKVAAFFEFVERIDPAGSTVVVTPDQLTWRSIVVRFTDGRFDDVETL